MFCFVCYRTNFNQDLVTVFCGRHLFKAQIFYKWNTALMLIHKVLSKAQNPLLLSQKSFREQLWGMCLGFLITPELQQLSKCLAPRKGEATLIQVKLHWQVQCLTYKEAITHFTGPYLWNIHYSSTSPLLHGASLNLMMDKSPFSMVEFKHSLTSQKMEVIAVDETRTQHTEKYCACYHYQSRSEFEPALLTMI